MKTFCKKNNVFIGHNAGQVPNADFSPQQGSRNTFIGSYSGWQTRSSDGIDNASDNTFVGYFAGASNLTGSANVFLGKEAGLTLTTATSNTLVIDNRNRGSSNGVIQNGLIYGNFDINSEEQLLRFNSNVIIRHQAKLKELGSGGYDKVLAIAGDGTLTTSNSDARLKENIIPLEQVRAKVKMLQGVEFNWIEDEAKSKRIGFIAQEVEKILPQLVFANKSNGYKGINYAEMSAVLVESFNEQQELIEQLQAEKLYMANRIEQFESENQNLQKQIDEIKNMLAK